MDRRTIVDLFRQTGDEDAQTALGAELAGLVNEEVLLDDVTRRAMSQEHLQHLVTVVGNGVGDGRRRDTQSNPTLEPTSINSASESSDFSSEISMTDHKRRFHPG